MGRGLLGSSRIRPRRPSARRWGKKPRRSTFTFGIQDKGHGKCARDPVPLCRVSSHAEDQARELDRVQPEVLESWWKAPRLSRLRSTLNRILPPSPPQGLGTGKHARDRATALLIQRRRPVRSDNELMTTVVRGATLTAIPKPRHHERREMISSNLLPGGPGMAKRTKPVAAISGPVTIGGLRPVMRAIRQTSAKERMSAVLTAARQRQSQLSSIPAPG